MKNSKRIGWVLLISFFVSFMACEQEADLPEKPELPPYETMAMDFSKFVDTKSTTMKGSTMMDLEQVTIQNWLYSSLTIGVWNVILFTKLAVPVTAFKTSFTQLPVYLGERKWQWSYTVDGFAAQYQARLTGEVVDEEVVWEMYITKTGINAFEEMLWFSGVSAKDRSHGFWVLNHSAAYPEELLRIDWVRESDRVGSIKYTYLRELKNNRESDPFKDSYILQGEQDTDYNLFYRVHAYNDSKAKFVDTDIEWSQSDHYGRVKALDYFNNDDWHCWDENGQDIECE